MRYMRRGISEIVGSIILLLIVLAIASGFYILTRNTSQPLKQDTAEKTEVMNSILTEGGEVVDLIEFSQSKNLNTIRKILTSLGYKYEEKSFDAFLKTAQTEDKNKFVFVGSPMRSYEFQWYDLANNVLGKSGKVSVILWDDGFAYPSTMIKDVFGMEIFKAPRVITNYASCSIDTNYFKIPTPIVHVKVSEDEYPNIPNELYVERVIGNYKKTDILYLSTSANVKVERKASGLITMNSLSTPVAYSDTINTADTFYYATFSSTTPILLVKLKSGDSTVYATCSQCEGVNVKWAKENSDGTFNCDGLSGYKIVSNDDNYVTIQTPTGDQVKVPWIKYTKLNAGSNTRVYLYQPLYINGVIYPVLAWKDRNGNNMALVDYVKSGSTFYFDSSTEMLPLGNNKFTLADLPFFFQISGTPGSTLTISVVALRKDYVMPSVIETTYKEGKFIFAPEFIFKDSTNALLFKYWFSDNN